jgi:hypothetical protein
MSESGQRSAADRAAGRPPSSSVTGLSSQRFRCGGRLGGGSRQLRTAVGRFPGGGQQLQAAAQEAVGRCGASHRDEGTAIGLPLSPIGHRKAGGGQKGVPADGEGQDCSAVQQPVVVPSSHGPEA